MTNALINQTNELSELLIDSSDIDVSWAEEEDREYLLESAVFIRKEVARAAYNIGGRLFKIREKLGGKYNNKIGAYYTQLGFTSNQANRWIRAYETIQLYLSRNPYDKDNEDSPIKLVSDTVLERIALAPQEIKEVWVDDIADGEIPTTKEVIEVLADPKVKLSKAEELLAKARIRREAKEAEAKDLPYGEKGLISDEIKNARKSEASYKQQIADLEAQIEKEKLNTAEEAEEKARVEKELQKLKFDDAAARAERVKRVSSTLTLSVPQTLADVQKFFAERNEYPEEVQKHLLQQCTLLANYIGDQL